MDRPQRGKSGGNRKRLRGRTAELSLAAPCPVLNNCEPATRDRSGKKTSRAFVGTGDHVLIPGFAVVGSGQLRLLIRAVGPTLADFGVAGPLADPVLTCSAVPCRLRPTTTGGTRSARLTSRRPRGRPVGLSCRATVAMRCCSWRCAPGTTPRAWPESAARPARRWSRFTWCREQFRAPGAGLEQHQRVSGLRLDGRLRQGATQNAGESGQAECECCSARGVAGGILDPAGVGSRGEWVGRSGKGRTSRLIVSAIDNQSALKVWYSEATVAGRCVPQTSCHPPPRAMIHRPSHAGQKLEVAGLRFVSAGSSVRR